jgi:hypothetical protein
MIIVRVLLRIRNPAQTPIAIDDSSTNPTMLDTRVGLRPIGNRGPTPFASARAFATAFEIGKAKAEFCTLTNVAPITIIKGRSHAACVAGVRTAAN